MAKKQQRGPTLGETLHAAREEAGLSKLQLEARSGVGRMSISRLEADWYQEPSPDDLVRLARALELNETDLFLLAGLPVPEHSASLEIMLRTSYGVSEDDVPALKQQIEDLIAQHFEGNSIVKGGGTKHDQANKQSTTADSA